MSNVQVEVISYVNTVDVKVAWSGFSEWSFYLYDVSSPKKSWFHISVNKSVKRFWIQEVIVYIFQLHVTYCISLIIMVNKTYHMSIHIFQTVHFSAVTFTRSNEKNMKFLLITKSHKKIWGNRKSDQALDFCFWNEYWQVSFYQAIFRSHIQKEI